MTLLDMIWHDRYQSLLDMRSMKKAEVQCWLSRSVRSRQEVNNLLSRCKESLADSTIERPNFGRERPV